MIQIIFTNKRFTMDSYDITMLAWPSNSNNRVKSISNLVVSLHAKCIEYNFLL